ncbi:tetratricopeptide repeat protein [Chitinimonas lacunae]|uniref:Tetratricopeptide repeat protein n=1 Tax=Chitinimonas lacunae TaxID=1963018 RepID=A0ABV8MSA2_9NEIS
MQNLIEKAFEHHRSGDFAAAEALYRSFLQEQPDHIDALFLLGTLLMQQENLQAALPLLERVVTQNPEHGQALYNIGLCLFVLEEWGQAADCFAKADDLLDLGWDIPYKRGYCALMQNQDVLVLHFMRRVLTLNPFAPNVRFYIVSSAIQLGRFATAAVEAERWARLPGQKEIAQAMLSRALSKGRLFDHAAQMWQPLPSDDPNYWFALGHAHHLAGELEQSAVFYKKAIAIQPQHSASHFNLSILLLTMGQLEEGWREFEWRFSSGMPVHKKMPEVPMWNGEDLTGKVIFVHSEQGFGDVIMFLRFMPWLEQRGGRVVFQSYDDIVGLLKNQADARPAEQVSLENLKYDYHIPMLSLGRIFANDLSTIPSSPYLDVPPDLLQKWADRLRADETRLKVGLVWSGNPHHINDYNRSATLAEFVALAELPGIRFYSLQKGPVAEQASYPPEGWDIESLSAEINDFSDTAAIIQNLDLVICVDTSVAHLAGALGKQVWMLLPSYGDWRWGYQGSTSPWYPSMRIFRQTREQDWPELIEQVRQALLDEMVCPAAGQDPLLDCLQAAARDKGDRLLAALQQSTWPEQAIRCAQRYLRQAGADETLRTALEQKAAEYGAVLDGISSEADTARQAANAIQGPFPNRLRLHGFRHLLKQAWGRGDLAQIRSLLDEMAASGLSACPDIHYWQAQLLRKDEAWQEAADCYDRYLEVYPRSPEALINQGLCFWRLERSDQALAQFEKAVLCNKNHEKAWFYLGWYLHELQHLEISKAVFEHAVARFSHSADMRLWLGNLRQRVGEFAQAWEDVQLAARMNPNLEGIPFRLISARGDAEGWQEADHLLTQAYRANPTDTTLGLKYAIRQFFRKNWSEGWPAWESRQRLPNGDTFARTFPDSTLPRWDGQALQQRRLLVFCEQGLGDTIQFARFVERIEGHVTYAVHDRLFDLFSAADLPYPLLKRSEVGDRLAQFDCYADVMSLPWLLGLASDAEMAPLQEPYLRPMLSGHRLEGHLADYRRPRVGIVWAGNQKHGDTHRRDCPFEKLLPLLARQDISWFSLQKDEPSNIVLYYPEIHPLLNNVAPEMEGWTDTACILQQLDLLICVDTALAHLAGAMGRPVWALLSKWNDWRWGEQGESTVWYSSMRLFRQDKLNDWAGLVTQIDQALNEFVRQFPATGETS